MNRPIDSIPTAYWPIDTPPSPGLDLNANLSPRVVGVSAFLFVLSFIVVTLRFVGRYLSKAGLWWDDWLILAAMIVSWGTCIICFVSAHYNFGKHEAALSILDAIDDSQSFFKALYAYETLYTIAVTLTKFSIILFYARIFTERSFRITLWVLSGFIGAWYVAVQLTQLLQCRPLSALWDGTYAENCIDLIQMFLVAGAINVVFNFILLVLPLPMIWGLEIDMKAKIGLTITFLLGAFVFVVSIARLTFVRRLNNVDVTWTYVDAAVWTTVEPNIAVVSASLPILRSLWILLSPRRTLSSQQRSLQKTGHKNTHYGGGAGGNTEKVVTFEDTPRMQSPENENEDVESNLIRGLSTRTKASIHHNTPVVSSAAFDGNDLVSPVYEGQYPSHGGYMSPGGVSDMTGPPTAGFPISRKNTTAARSEDSYTPLTAASELSAHKSLPYGGAEYSRYTVNISSENSQSNSNSNSSRSRSLSRNPSEKPSIASRMGIRSPKLGGSSPKTPGQNSDRSSWGDDRSIEMTKLPIQGGGSKIGRKTPSPGPAGPVKIERVDSDTLGVARGHSSKDSGSLTGYPAVAELYA